MTDWLTKHFSSTEVNTREGTHKEERLLRFLSSDYVKFDEQKLADHIDFGKKYSELIQYYDEKNKASGNWLAFFENIEQEKKHQPHAALFYVFLDLLTYLQEKTNALTEKHLDYYYRDVLRFIEKEARPDQAFVLFELAYSVKQHQITAQTPLLAGKDVNGEDLIYCIDKDVTLSHAKIVSIKSVFADKSFEQRVYASPVADSVDGLGTSFEAAEVEMQWMPFGKAQATLKSEEKTMLDSNIGFALASPILLLKEGKRTICLKLNCQSPITFPERRENPLAQAFIIYFSGEEEWIGPFVADGIATENMLTIEVTLPEIAPSIVPYNSNILKNPFNTSWPLMKVVLNTQLESYAYPWLKNLELNTARLQVDVENIRDLLVQNDEGILDPNAPFTPFGSTPSIGSSFYIGSEEAFFKKLDTCKLFIDWEMLPAASLDSYYAKYVQPSVESALKALKKDRITEVLNGFNLQVSDLDEIDQQIDHFKTLTKEKTKLQAVERAKKVGLSDEEAEIEAEKSAEIALSLKASQLANDIASILVQDSDTSLETEDAIEEENDESLSTVEQIKKIIQDATPVTTQALDTGNSLFKVNLGLIQNKVWRKLQNRNGLQDEDTFFSFHLFNQDNAYLTAELNCYAPDGYERILPEAQPLDRYNNKTQTGFIKMVLATPLAPFEAFGHKQYQDLLSEISTLNAIAGKEIYPPPGEPYTPLIRSLSLSYSSSQEISFSSSNYPQRIEQFFHIDAFGESEVHPVTHDGICSLLPQYSEEGHLYIGLTDLQPGQTVNFLFRVAEGTADAELHLTEDDLQWKYLSENQWKALPKINILSDSTHQLQESGIITIEFPKDINNDNTAMPDNLYWISAALRQNASLVSQLVAIHTQAASATAAYQGSGRSIAPGAITGLQETDSAVVQVSQPYASFNGRESESREAFYTRVSERLRHKNRAVSLWDYERLVLEQFPNIYKVKCLNHTRYTERNKGGAVTIVVIPDMREQRPLSLLEPRTRFSTLEAIKNYLRGHTSPFIDIQVINPRFERIHIDVQVHFHNGYDSGFYSKQLNEDLKRFLSPWAYQVEAWKQLNFTTKIYKSRVIAFMEKLPYVDFIYSIKLQQHSKGEDSLGLDRMMIIEGSGQDDEAAFTVGGDQVIDIVEAAIATTPESILVSAPYHTINVISDVNALIEGVEGIGIDYMSVEWDFQVGQPIENGIGALTIDDDFQLTLPGRGQ